MMKMTDEKQETLIITGNEASAWGARRSKAHVVTAFPITPQTTVMETISEFVDSGKMQCNFVKVESEHSVMAGMVGASMTGARCFTATSGQGLLYMAEMVHWVSGSRLPVVTTIASRGIAPPWNIWVDYSDILSMRDSGWIIQFASTHQEIFDSILMSYKLAEDPRVMLPVFIAYGGFSQSHTSKPVVIPSQKAVDDYLPPVPDDGWPHLVLNPEKPIVHGNLLMPQQEYMEFRYKMHETIHGAKPIIKEVIADFHEKFGRNYHGLIESYRCDDAKYILVTVGALGEQVKDAVDTLRSEGKKVGSIKIRYFRPFPKEDLVEILGSKNLEGIVVVDRSIAYGSPTGGHISSEFSNILSELPSSLTYLPAVWGLGGRDVTVGDQESVFNDLINLHEENEIKETSNSYINGTLWVNLKVR
ncbi:pyruvate ferredoxin oxidoreductase [Candidatus Bathyarchaeota archaeon]|nr:pyruvate ferredoxin oxidoreductase [Candidatus Bathyarchaeota archaeon]